MSIEELSRDERDKAIIYERLLTGIRNSLEKILVKKLGVGEAEAKRQSKEVAAHVYEKVLKIDAVIDGLLKDKSLASKYDYDGFWFKKKGAFEGHFVINGVNILASLEKYMGAYFNNNSAIDGIKGILQMAQRRLEEAQAAQRNWQELGVVSSIDPRLINDIVEVYKSDESKGRTNEDKEEDLLFNRAPHSRKEWQNFFSDYEAQMREKEKNK